MNKHILTAGILIASLALTCRSFAQTYDANAAFQANELGLTEDSSLFAPFSVGFAENFGDLIPFTAGEHTNAFAGDPNTQGFITLNNVIVPAVVVNISNVANGAFGLLPREILLHPGGRGPNGFDAPYFDGVLRFTAPSAGLYTIRGNFRSIDSGFTENNILRNGTSVLTIGNAGNFRLTLSLAANDVVDFSVGDGGDGIGSDSTGLTATLAAGLAAPQIVNIDFNGKRPGDADSAGTYVGLSAAGLGTVFNGLNADSTGGDDNLTISGSSLLNDAGLATGVAFTLSPVGGDHEPGQPFEPASLYDDYVFNHTAGNVAPPAGSPFTIRGLTDATTADLYFYLNGFNGGTIAINGFAGPGVTGIYNGLSAVAFLDVPVVAGSVTGSFGANGGVGVMGGLTVVSVPEPGTAALLGLGVLAGLRRRRRNA